MSNQYKVGDSFTIWVDDGLRELFKRYITLIKLKGKYFSYTFDGIEHRHEGRGVWFDEIRCPDDPLRLLKEGLKL